MKVLFDLTATQPYGNTMFHGGGEYTKEVFIRLVEKISFLDSIDVFWDNSLHIDDQIKKICSECRISNVGCINTDQINRQLSLVHYDSFFSGLPYRFYGLVMPKETRFVYTIHGLRRLELPIDEIYYEYSSNMLKKYAKKFIDVLLKKRIAKDADRQFRNLNKLFSVSQNQVIITDSNHSKASILNYFDNICENNIKVCYSPEKHSSVSGLDDTILNRLGIVEKKYILIISANRWEKNALRAVQALDSLFSRKMSFFEEDIKVLVLGVSDSIVFERHIKNKERFVLKGYVDEADLNYLYESAHLFLYPSLNEGFGYPPLEAIRRGTLCACAADTSIPEVCGDAVLYFKPDDLMEISNRVIQSFNPIVRDLMMDKMKKHYKNISDKQKEDTDKLLNYILCRD